MKPGKLSLIIGFVLALSVDVKAQSCSTILAGGSGFNNQHFVNVLSTGTPYDSELGPAEYTWNNSCGGMAGSKYPELSADPSSGANVTISYVNGSQASPTCVQNTVYCSSVYDQANRTITLYENFGPDPNNFNHLSQYPGQSMINLLAHELGHVLGVADDSCANGLMNQQIPDNPTITDQECQSADQATHVLYEGTSNEGCTSLMDCHMSPIVIDLDGGGVRFTSVADGVEFDLDGDGVPEKTAWTPAGSNEALLWIDRNGNGVVDSGSELFGSLFGANGFDQLKVWDTPAIEDVIYGGNGNGRIDPGDKIWSKLRLWIDSNHDGISQPNEIFTLDEKGVTSIDLSYRTVGRVDRNGNFLRYESFATVRGKRVTVVDVFFEVQR